MMAESEGPRWSLIINGGAKAMKAGEAADNRRGALQAVREGSAVLAHGGSALDAVEAAIRVMESLPVFNAGLGSSLNQAGQVEMCSGIMDGRDLEVGAVGAIMGVRHPISVARRVLAEKEILIVGEGARAFARDHHVEIVDREALITPERVDEAHDTVGAVALDRKGDIAVGTSTGGLTGTRVGRVGDSPICGAGFYADNKVGGVAFSGDGETIARLVLASQVIARMTRDGPEAAIAGAVAKLPPLGGEGADGGGIAITADGRIGWAHNSPAFVVGVATSAMNRPGVWLSKQEASDHVG